MSEPAAPAARTVAYDATRLQAVGARPPLGRYLRELWAARHFVVYDARVRLSVSQDHTLLGKAWLIVNPLLLGATFYLIFGLLLGTDRGIENFTGYLVIGFMMFLYTPRSFSAGARSIQQGRNLIRGFSFPRAALPLSIILREAMSQVYVLAAMVLLILVLPPAEPVTVLWLLLIPIVVLQTLFNAGIAMLFAPLVHRVPDVSHLIGAFNRLWMYSSGLFYDPASFTDHPVVLALFQANPLHQVLQMTRSALLRAEAPPLESWLILGAWSLGALVVGTVVFWLHEESYADERR